MKLHIITAHSVDRFLQRFKLRINRSMWNNRGVRHMINIMFKQAIRSDLQLRNQIGLYNSKCIEYGELSKIIAIMGLYLLVYGEMAY